MSPADLTNDPWAFGPWCFVVDTVRLLDEPIPCRGMQGWWPLEEHLRARLSALCPMGTYVTSALTLLQPYASAIACGPKRVENRPTRRGIPPGGVWLGLHAGKALHCPSDWYDDSPGAPRRAEQAEDWVDQELTAWRVGEDGEPSWPDAPPVDQLPRGCLLGVMRIVECLRFPDEGPLFGGSHV